MSELLIIRDTDGEYCYNKYYGTKYVFDVSTNDLKNKVAKYLLKELYNIGSGIHLDRYDHLLELIQNDGDHYQIEVLQVSKLEEE